MSEMGELIENRRQIAFLRKQNAQLLDILQTLANQDGEVETGRDDLSLMKGIIDNDRDILALLSDMNKIIDTCTASIIRMEADLKRLLATLG